MGTLHITTISKRFCCRQNQEHLQARCKSLCYKSILKQPSLLASHLSSWCWRIQTHRDYFRTVTQNTVHQDLIFSDEASSILCSLNYLRAHYSQADLCTEWQRGEGKTRISVQTKLRPLKITLAGVSHYSTMRFPKEETLRGHYLTMHSNMLNSA